jgi:hypothetical protein
MSGRRFEVTGTQVVASVLATLTGAIAASYLGVAGTIIGAAVMSVAGTAGSAIYKDYLGRTGRRLRQAAPVMAQRAHELRTAAGVPGTAQRSAHPDGSGGETPADPREPGEPGEPGDSRDAAAAPAGDGERRGPGRGGWLHARPRWALAAVASAGIFVGVLAGITVFELAAGKPLAAVVWHRSGSGTSVGGGNVSTPTPAVQPGHTSPAARHATSPAGSASPSPGGTRTSPASPSPSPTPSSGSPSPSSSPSPSPSASQTTTPASTRTP